MQDDSDLISCDAHGQTAPTYVCSHLAKDPAQKWFCDFPAPDDAWPDAWCSECNAAFEREGEWNEQNEAELEVKMLCTGCYEDGIAKSVSRLKDQALSEWRDYAGDQCHALQAKQNALFSEFPINDYSRWDYHQESAQLIFSESDRLDLIADVEFVGTFSNSSNTWMWSWANFSLLEPVRSRVHAVREFGEDRDYPHLTVPIWPAEQADAWEMTGIAADILGARGAYRAPTANGFIFMVIMDAYYKPSSGE